MSSHWMENNTEKDRSIFVYCVSKHCVSAHNNKNTFAEFQFTFELSEYKKLLIIVSREYRKEKQTLLVFDSQRIHLKLNIGFIIHK